MSAPERSFAAGPCPRTTRVVQHGVPIDARCSSRSCPSCGVLWLGDTRIRVLAACQELAAAVALVSVTAPGVHLLPWDPTTGRVDADEARWWNESAPERWSSLHKRAADDARAVGREHGVEWRLLVKAWEYQKRGVLHLHLIVPCGNSAERAASEAYVAALVLYGPQEGFGFVDRGKLPASGPRRSARELCPVSPHRAAAYVASYVSSSGAGKEGIAEVARKQGVPGAVVYVSNTLTRKSGVTMRSLRARRRVLMQYDGCGETAQSWAAACVVDGLRRSRAPFTPQDRRRLYDRALADAWGGGIDAATGEVLPPTDAAPPPPVSEAVRQMIPSRRRVVVRLDCVPHRDHDVGDHRAVVTAAVVVTLT
ncbi:MAG TPA: hypothetical protein VK486_17320 [Thermoleophilaceae bacterium]|nr:hypothetical protein [Thermoleophilaceae bacterium]